MNDEKTLSYKRAKRELEEAELLLEDYRSTLHDRCQNTRRTEVYADYDEQKRLVHRLRGRLIRAERALSHKDRLALGLDDEAVQS